MKRLSIDIVTNFPYRIAGLMQCERQFIQAPASQMVAER